MAFVNLKFDESDFGAKDITSLPDRPGDAGITAAELKARFDRIGKDMLALGRFNDLINELTAGSAAAQIGASVEGMAQTTVGGVLSALKTEVEDRYPKANSYSRVEIDHKNAQTLGSAKLYTDEAVFASGAADMQRAIYDPQGKKQDIFAYADTKVEKVEGMGLSANDYSDAQKALVSGALQTSGGSMTGALIMGGPQAMSVAQVRNIQIGHTIDEVIEGVTPLPLGTLLILYDPPEEE